MISVVNGDLGNSTMTFRDLGSLTTTFAQQQQQQQQYSSRRRLDVLGTPAIDQAESRPEVVIYIHDKIKGYMNWQQPWFVKAARDQVITR